LTLIWTNLDLSFFLLFLDADFADDADIKDIIWPVIDRIIFVYRWEKGIIQRNKEGISGGTMKKLPGAIFAFLISLSVCVQAIRATEIYVYPQQQQQHSELMLNSLKANQFIPSHYLCHAACQSHASAIFAKSAKLTMPS
jgi:hypothetical protein